jgi:hypothetical protein
MVEPSDLDALIERVGAIKHDLGKYVAWTSANLDDALWQGPLHDELIDALRADLLETRKLADRSEPAWVVWAGHRAALPVPLEPELEFVAAAVARLEQLEPALRERDREALAAARPLVRSAQQDIRKALLDLHRRLLARARGR